MRWATVLLACVPAWAQGDLPVEVQIRPAPQATIVHDVRDLLPVLQAAPARPRQARAWRLEREGAVGEPLVPVDQPRGETESAAAETALVELLQAFAPKELALQLQGKGGMLFGSLTPEQGQWLAQTLDHQRTNLAARLAFEIRLVTLPATGLDELRPGGPPLVLISDAQRDALLARVTAADGHVTALPGFATAPLARATTSALNKIAYVRGYELCVNVQPGGQTIADPQIDHALDGVEATANALLLPEGAVGLLLRLQEHDLQKPIATTKAKLGEMEVDVAVPNVRRSALRATLQLQPGQTIAFVPPENRGSTRAVMVTLSKTDGAK